MSGTGPARLAGPTAFGYNFLLPSFLDPRLRVGRDGLRQRIAVGDRDRRRRRHRREDRRRWEDRRRHGTPGSPTPGIGKDRPFADRHVARFDALAVSVVAIAAEPPAEEALAGLAAGVVAAVVLAQPQSSPRPSRAAAVVKCCRFMSGSSGIGRSRTGARQAYTKKGSPGRDGSPIGSPPRPPTNHAPGSPGRQTRPAAKMTGPRVAPWA